MNIEPAVLRHAGFVYSALAEEAEPNEELAPDKTPVYVGHWTSILFKLEKEGRTNRQAAYKAMKFLVDAGCVERLQKGTKENPSIMVLNYPPSMEIYKGQSSPTMTSRKSSVAMLKQQVIDLTARLGELSDRQEAEARNFNATIDILVKRLAKLESQSLSMSHGDVLDPPALPEINWRDYA